MTGGGLCCQNNCGHNANNGFKTCCMACKGESGPHTQQCMDRQSKCNNCNRKATCINNRQNVTCCRTCKGQNGPHTQNCNIRNNLQLQQPSQPTGQYVIVNEQWGPKSWHVTPEGFIVDWDVTPHVEFINPPKKNYVPKKGDVFYVGQAYINHNGRGNAIVRDLIGVPTGSDYHITVYYNKLKTGVTQQVLARFK